MNDSPVMREIRNGPRGNGQWTGYDKVYARLQLVAHKLGAGRRVYQTYYATHCERPSQDHIDVMAALGSGHEERMKATLHYCITRGWLTVDDINNT